MNTDNPEKPDLALLKERALNLIEMLEARAALGISTIAAPKHKPRLERARQDIRSTLYEFDWLFDEMSDVMPGALGFTYERMLRLVDMAYTIGAYSVASEGAKQYLRPEIEKQKVEMQAEVARVKKATINEDRHKKLREAIVAVAAKLNLKLVTGQEFSKSIHPDVFNDVRNRLDIPEEDKTWPSAQTIRREIVKMNRGPSCKNEPDTFLNER
jgi:hypothetical protein